MGWATCVWPIPRSSAQPFILECNHTYSVHVCSIASVLEAQGKYDAALDMYNKSLEIKIKVLGHEHPDTTLIQKRYTSMHACVCMHACKLMYGMHPHMYGSIGNVYLAQARYPQALKQYSKGLAVEERTLGHEDLTTAATKNKCPHTFRFVCNHPSPAFRFIFFPVEA